MTSLASSPCPYMYVLAHNCTRNIHVHIMEVVVLSCTCSSATCGRPIYKEKRRKQTFFCLERCFNQLHDQADRYNYTCSQARNTYSLCILVTIHFFDVRVDSAILIYSDHGPDVRHPCAQGETDAQTDKQTRNAYQSKLAMIGLHEYSDALPPNWRKLRA